MVADGLSQQNACLETVRVEHLTSTTARQMCDWQLKPMRTRHPGTMQAMLTVCCLDSCVAFSSTPQSRGSSAAEL